MLRVDVGRLRRYFRENWGAPFVIGFQLLLLACAVLLVGGESALANQTAMYAYYLLVAGIVLQLISFMRARKRMSKRDDEPVEGFSEDG